MFVFSVDEEDEISIKETAEIISKAVGFTGEIKVDWGLNFFKNVFIKVCIYKKISSLHPHTFPA